MSQSAHRAAVVSRGPVMIMAGGTGGHVFPALAVAQELRRLGMEVVWLGTRQGLEARVVPQAGFEMEWLSVSGLRGKGWAASLLAPFMLLKALWQAGAVIKRRRPRLVMGLGGFVSGPGGLMARMRGLPLCVHEQNAIAGMTNRWLARFAHCVMEAFPGSFGNFKRPVTLTGNPVRAELTALPPPHQRLAGRSGPLRLLVLGGSLGAQRLNEILPQALALLPEDARPQVRHQVGSKHRETAEQCYRQANVQAEVIPFIEDMAQAYSWADISICRAGALTLSELCAVGLGAILVPYPHAVDDHQWHNAQHLAKAGAALTIRDQDLSAGDLAQTLRRMHDERETLLHMAQAARGLARPDAAAQVVQNCLQCAGLAPPLAQPTQGGAI